jgi:cytochrome bd ubiquinol oxidase subunit II
MKFWSGLSLVRGVAGHLCSKAGWLILKTDGEVQAAARRYGRICLIGVIIAIGIVSIWTP